MNDNTSKVQRKNKEDIKNFNTISSSSGGAKTAAPDKRDG